VAEDGMASLELLARAADSLDMQASREGPSLKVHLFPSGGATLIFSDERGGTTPIRRVGIRMPQWLRILVPVLCIFALVLLGFRTAGQSMLLNGFLLTVSLLTFVSAKNRRDAAEERLLDRAFDMETSGLGAPRLGSG
jgi:hypothetical protein